MNVYSKLKEITFLRRIVKKVNVYKAFFQDAWVYNKYNMEESYTRGEYDFRLLLLAHSIEKGMCMSELRPFGQNKCIEIMSILQKYSIDKYSHSACKIAFSVLEEWCKVFEENGWINDFEYRTIKEFVEEKKNMIKKVDAGCVEKTNTELWLDSSSTYELIVSSRRAVRNYNSQSLNDNDIEKCVKMAQMAPSACNRQMCKIVYVCNEEKCKSISKIIQGVSGFTLDTTKYFIISYDIRAFDGYGERNQGYFNAGLFAMNFVNALHSFNIQTCFLQYATSYHENKKMHELLEIPEYEKIVTVIGAGYADEKVKLAKSSRKNIGEVYRKI